MTGRRRDPVWAHFISVEKPYSKTIRAKCKRCNSEVVGLVARMKNHLKNNCDRAKGDQGKETEVSSNRK